MAERRFWTREETTKFLNAYNLRKNEFMHARKRKFAMQNVLEDLISANALEQEATVEHLNTKIKNLLRAFKAAKDNGRQTGAAPNIAPYENLMEEIFGDSPIIRCEHSISVRGSPAVALPRPSPEASTRSNNERSGGCCNAGRDSACPPKEVPQRKGMTTFQMQKVALRRKNAEHRINILKTNEENRQRRFEEAERSKAERHKEKMELLRKLAGEFLD